MSAVAAIVLNWNRLDQTASCCQALLKQNADKLDVWVVDNGSTTHSQQDLVLACPDAHVIRLHQNLGFAGGVNAGIRVAQKHQTYDFYWLVNNDARCAPEALPRLLDVMADSRVAAASCGILEGGLMGAPKYVLPGKKLKPPFYVPIRVGSASRIDYLSGACLLIRDEAWRVVGTFDDRFFFFFEDADWSFRARRLGWRLGVAPGNWVHHAGSGTIGDMARPRAAFYREGHVRFLRKYSRHPWVSALPPLAFRMLMDTLKGDWPSLKGNREGWRRGWKD